MHRLTDALGAMMGTARRLVRRRSPEPDTGSADVPRDYNVERETDRVGAMSAEDRAWETASRERNRAAEAGEQSPPERD